MRVDDEFDRTIFIMETEPGPPASQPRWYCYEREPGFETPEEGVAWALTKTDRVMVQSLAGQCYWAGSEPTEWDEEDGPLSPWPPSAGERREIDETHARLVERLAEAKRIAPALASAIAERLADVLPPPWSARSVDRGEPAVVLTRYKHDVASYALGEFLVEKELSAILDGIQDEISEETTDPWPSDPDGGVHLWEPKVEVIGDVMRAWYGPKDNPVLTLEPIDMARLRD